MDFPTRYNPNENEASTYKQWEDSGFFNPDKLPGKRKESFSISMPPPNATGILHAGHAVMLALQDILIRFERMRGKRTLWVPGTDHAAIATQNVVEQKLKKEERKTKRDLGREEFLKRVDSYVAASQGTIKQQIRTMGASCDWSRERFTLDEGLSTAVHEAFIRFYEDGLIYRGLRVVNWCPKDQSTLADDEVEYAERPTTLYTFKYDATLPFAISTTRPETKFGDTAIAVHPDDQRYRQYVGKSFMVNFAGVGRTIKVIANKEVDPNYGTGALGVTPAHSAVDEAMAKKEGLDSLQVISKEGTMMNSGSDFDGMKVAEAREKLVELLKHNGLVEKAEPITHNLSLCYRCGTPIEPLPSEQWFIAVDKKPKSGGKTLKERSLEVLEKNEITFLPDRFAKEYRHWMENLHDWCISRQIWYGHRIPVWYKDSETKVAKTSPGEGWTQDIDTLDTWFSSGLWTFSTLGWPTSVKTTAGRPEKTGDLQAFHPTSVMETGYDILFFWVARMILMSTYLVGEIPFKTVYLHGLVRDTKGRKMSKSLGNGIDPSEMAEQYGADAVRLSLVIGTTPGNDQRLSKEKIAGYRNYATKLWNMGRFLSLQEDKGSEKPSSLAEKWIMSKLHRLVESVSTDLERFAISKAGEDIYEFAWHEFADWYLEIVKVEGNTKLAKSVFRDILKLLHPFMPFVTEALWKQLDYGKDLLMVEEWPNAEKKLVDEEVEKQFATLQTFVMEYRKQRKDAGIVGRDPLKLAMPDDELIQTNKALIERLAKVEFEK